MVQSLSGRLFCRALNIVLLMRGLRERCTFDSFLKLYKIGIPNVSGTSLYFSNQKMGYVLYNKGKKYRADWIGNEYLLNLIKFNPQDVIVDCGANIGDLKLYFSETINCQIEYYGFEPSPLEYECLKRNVYPSTAFNKGLWHEDGVVDFYISSDGGDSSFVQPPFFEKIIKIPTSRLDTSLGELKKIKLLKVEAEGAELEVLSGTLHILKNIEFISADLGFERGINKESTFQPVIDFLYKHNFSLIHFTLSPRLIALFKNNLY